MRARLEAMLGSSAQYRECVEKGERQKEKTATTSKRPLVRSRGGVDRSSLSGSALKPKALNA